MLFKLKGGASVCKRWWDGQKRYIWQQLTIFPPIFSSINLFYSVFTTLMFTQAEGSSVSGALITVCVWDKGDCVRSQTRVEAPVFVHLQARLSKRLIQNMNMIKGGKGKGWVKSVSINGLIWTEWRAKTTLWQCGDLWVCVRQHTSHTHGQATHTHALISSHKVGGGIDCSMQVFCAVLTGFPGH